MKKQTLLVSLLALVVFSGCKEEHKIALDGQKLLEQKCSACHNLDLPPKTYADEKAPPMMAVAFHIKDFIHATNESEKIPKAIDFVKDYVVNPSASKSFCDKKSLQTYGVMPSQKGKVTQDELQAIAEYMFEHYTVKNLTEAQAQQNKLAKMAPGERLVLKYKCVGCHKVDKDLVGPSFSHIAKRYGSNTQEMLESITNGSKGKWKMMHNRIMPAFANIPQNQKETMVSWIQKQ
jgi:cytochrome c